MEGSGCDGVGVTALDILSPSTLKVYEAQFFGFTPQTCMFRIYSAFQDCLCGILLVVEKVCVRKLKKRDNRQDEDLLQSKARECSQKLYEFLEERFQSFSKRMDALLVDKCFSIPSNVLLPGDKPHRKSPGDFTELWRVESSLAALQRAHQAELCARQVLLAELEEQREVREQLDGILRWVGELQTTWLKEGLGSFNVMESAKKLQDTVAEICDNGPKEPDS